MTAVRTVERGYYAGNRRAGQVRRVHVLRDTDGPGDWLAGSRFWCGQGAWDVTHSPAVVRDVPHELPEGLTWCGHCLGKLAEQLGRLGDVARLLGVEMPGDH